MHFIRLYIASEVNLVSPPLPHIPCPQFSRKYEREEFYVLDTFLVSVCRFALT